MRKRLFQLLLAVIVITAAVISIIIGRFSYDFAKNVFRENREDKILRIEKQFDHYQSILHSIEVKMDSEGGKALRAIYRELPDPGAAGRISPEKLKSLAGRLGVDHIYFIGPDGRVFNSSLKSDIDLNLLNVSPAFTRYINSIYGRGEVISQGISVSINEGNINHYMYFSPAGSRMIYEISTDVQKFFKDRYNFALYEFLFGDMFKNFYNDYIISIDIYSIAGSKSWSLINHGKKTGIDKELLSTIITKGEAVVEKDNRINVYRKIKMNKYMFNRTTTVYIELVYDSTVLSQYTKRIILYSIFSCIIITGIVFFIATMRMNDMIIERMLNIIESLKRVKNGDEILYIEDDAGDEISDISSNINIMTRTIKQRSDEISKTNKQLREMTIFINDIIESMPSALISINEKDKIIQWNREAEIISGITASEADGKELWDAIPQLYKYRAKCDEVRQKRTRAELYGESFIVEKSGIEEVFTKNIYIFPFSKEQITGIIIRIDDITELARKEEQLERAKKAEALGTMAGGLAHDFNNIIAGIISTASYLDVILKSHDETFVYEIREHLNIIRNSGEKAAGLVKKLMSFSKKRSLDVEKIDLSKIITDTAGIASASADRGIEFEILPGRENSFVSGDRSQIEQVLLNLIVNAADAVTQNNLAYGIRGRISVTLEKSETGERPINSTTGYLWDISVSDNGPGIDKENLDRIFDPFFTTKKEGNGLGLAIVNTIITGHGGLIKVNSEKGAGTTFHIYLPAV